MKRYSRFLLFTAAMLTVAFMTMAAVDDSGILPVVAVNTSLIQKIETAGNSITAIWASQDSVFKEPYISVFPYGAPADSFSIYLITAPDGAVMINTFRTGRFDSVHLHRPDSLVFLSGYVLE